MLTERAIPFTAVELEAANSPRGKLKFDERQRRIGKSANLKKVEDMTDLRAFLKQARARTRLVYHASEESRTAAALGARHGCA